MHALAQYWLAAVCVCEDVLLAHFADIPVACVRRCSRRVGLDEARINAQPHTRAMTQAELSNVYCVDAITLPA